MDTLKKKTNMENLNKNPKKPNEMGTVRIQGHIKIYDPNTKEVFVNKNSKQ